MYAQYLSPLSYLHLYRALEVFTIGHKSWLFVLADYEAVRRAVASLPRVGVGLQYGLPSRRQISLAHPRRLLREVCVVLFLDVFVRLRFWIALLRTCHQALIDVEYQYLNETILWQFPTPPPIISPKPHPVEHDGQMAMS